MTKPTTADATFETSWPSASADRIC
ncbi:hypothetical protein CCACVL1_03037 [Corchorus capsularis]|uniref:Uncharacterized protein n=1 Tax=Corchorus capsularis TaxID=210143 RepID=A0A1R3K3K9_COCAP|nr:hypothetical protein CCACVL1_03037 [Corchorus capsularis]